MLSKVEGDKAQKAEIMNISLNHTIVSAKDPDRSARFLSEILGLPAPETVGHFTVVQVGETSLDFAQTESDIHPQHFSGNGSGL